MKAFAKLCMIPMVLLLVSCEKEPPLETDDPLTKVRSRIDDFKEERIYLEANQWTERADLEPRYGHTSEVFQEKIWILGGIANDSVTNDVLSSENGLVWQSAPPSGNPLLNDIKNVKNQRFTPRTDHASAVFKGKLWVVGGKEYDPMDHDAYLDPDGPNHDHSRCDVYSELGDIWSSDDGINWDLVTDQTPFSPRYDHELVAYKGALYLFGGFSRDNLAGYQASVDMGYKDAYRSYDGIHWEAVPNFEALHSYGDILIGAASEVFKDVLLVVGGPMVGPVEDIFHSSDGNTWNSVHVGPEIADRHHHGLVTDEENLWLTAGSFTDDIYYSGNGLTWRKAELSDPFPARSHHSSVFFNNRIWVINGYSSETQSALSDIWSFGEPGCCDIDDITWD